MIAATHLNLGCIRLGNLHGGRAARKSFVFGVKMIASITSR
ncbi:hypothetical protein [Pendulispora albinea]